MPRMLPVLLLGACTEADLAQLQAHNADSPTHDAALRTEVHRLGEARLLPDGPPLEARADPQQWSMEPLEVVEVGRRLRVLYDARDAAVLLWLDPEDLGRWLVAGSSGGSRPGAPMADTGVWFSPGVEVDVLDTDGAWTAVEVRRSTLVATAWVPSMDIGPYWVDSGPDDADPFTADAWIRTGAELLDRPDGDALAQVPAWPDSAATRSVLGAQVLDRIGGYAKIEAHTDGVTVRAWVHELDIGDWNEGGWGSVGMARCGGSFGWGVANALHVPAGAELFAEPDGEPVGSTTRARDWGVVDRSDGWAAIDVPTRWGAATVWLWEG